MLELLFVGAGPHTMATLSRLLEPHPDPGVDAPQRHVVSKRKVLSYWQWQRTCPTYRAELTEWLKTHVAVVDPAGSWMSRWQQQFSALGISHLRSTTAVHPDPLDSFALATYASATGRSSEQMPLQHIEKSREFSGPFAVPSARLFEDFCGDLVQRYCLDAALVKDKVVQLTPVPREDSACTLVNNCTAAAAEPGGSNVSHWVVHLASGRQLTARRVLLGIGSTNMTRVPEALQHLQPVPVLQPPPPAAVAVAAESDDALAGTHCVPTSSGSISAPLMVATVAASSDSDSSSASTAVAPAAHSLLLPQSVTSSLPPPPQSVSECCTSAYGCDGGCSNSSGWSSDSCVDTATAVGASNVVASCGSPAFTKQAVTAAAAADSRSSNSSVSSPRSDCCDSLGSWLDLGAAEQQWAGPATAQLSDSALPTDAGVDAAAESNSVGSSTKPDLLPVLPLDVSVAAAVEPGPCNWVVTSAVNSPTGSAAACDSLCSWLGCEHTVAQQQQQKEAAQPVVVELSASNSSGCGGDVCGDDDSSTSSSSAINEQAAATAAAADGDAAAGTANCYPWGRLMHAWQLVEALAEAGTTTDSQAPTTDNNTNSSTSSQAVGGRSAGKKGRHNISSSSLSSSILSNSNTSRRSKSLHSSRASTRCSTQSAALLLQERGLAAPGDRVVIVGGGLTSAHLAVLAAAATHPTACAVGGGKAAAAAAGRRAGGKASSSSASDDSGGCQDNSSSSSSANDSSRVLLLLRGPLRVKQFNVDIEWMGRNRGSTLQFGFKQLSQMEDRLKLMRRVLQGGSITPEAAGLLAELQQGQPAGVLHVCEEVQVVDASWDWEQQQWDIWLQDGSVLHADRLWMATGSALSAPADPLLASLLQQLPVPLVSGLPAIQPSLEWAPGSGAYVLGAYAALQLGPGALNLAGAKTGSVAVAQHLKRQLPELPAASFGFGALNRRV